MLGFHKPNADERLDAFKAKLKVMFDNDPGVQQAFIFGAKPSEQQQVSRVALFIQRIVKRGEATLLNSIHVTYDSVYEDTAPGPLDVTFFEVDALRQLSRAGAPFYVRRT